MTPVSSQLGGFALGRGLGRRGLRVETGGWADKVHTTAAVYPKASWDSRSEA